MNKYKIEVGAMVTILEDIELEIDADNMEEAVEIADKTFREYLADKYSWYDMDDVTVDYIEKI